MKTFYTILAVLAFVGLVPSLYLGAVLMVKFDTFYVFPIPQLVCLFIAGFSMTKVEEIL